MTYIKKLVMHGFKSFAKETEVIFDKGLNTIVGPNGSGKSNISDAICFVLGRLSMKSIRAAKTSNLIYNGGSQHKPSEEARVDMYIDNSDKVIPSSEEIIITRIVKRDGQGIYKINNETKTREQVLDLLAQGGINPYGFNIVLQGEISQFVEMNAQERREIIEDIAGITVYEDKKAKSLRELEKTDEQLKLVNATLHERYTYLKNLDKERQDALRFQELETLIKREKASIVAKDLKEKRKEKEEIEESIEKDNTALQKAKTDEDKVKEQLRNLNEETEKITRNIQESTGIQQETFHKEIVEGKSDIAGLSVRLENYKSQLAGISEKDAGLLRDIENEKKNVEELKKKIPEQAKLEKLLNEKRKAFEAIQNKYERLAQLKSDLAVMNSGAKRNKEHHSSVIKEMASLQQKISELNERIKGFEHEIKEIDNVKKRIEHIEKSIIEKESLYNKYIGECSGTEKEMQIIARLKADILKLDVCPTCKKKVTEDDKQKVVDKTEKETAELLKNLSKYEKLRDEAKNSIIDLRKEIEELRKKHSNLHIAKINFENLEEKKNTQKNFDETRKKLEGEIEKLESKSKELELEIKKYSEIEREYERTKLEIQELSTKETIDVQATIMSKENDLQRMQLMIKQNARNRQELEVSIKNTEEELKQKEKAIGEKEKKEKNAYEQFNQMFEKRNKLQASAHEVEITLVNKQNDSRKIEDGIHLKKITLAQIDAQFSTLDNEFKQFGEIQLVEASKNELTERINRHQFSLSQIGSVNMRALQVYDDVKKEYDIIQDKSLKLENEKTEILKIIDEIDRKKRITFVKTLGVINDLFSQNYLKLVGKGEAFLELENKENPFEGGLAVTIRLAKGKYADATALSGGEQVLTALSLIFAIQEYKPYCFYIFDEIDAALDKRNSERLGGLIRDYIRTGQYIVITHNDAVISEAATLYGISMQDGISRVFSLKI